MARVLPLLDAAQRREFDSPPKFTAEQRLFFFSRPEWAEPLLRAMSAGHMRSGFLLQLGYFKEGCILRFAGSWRNFLLQLGYFKATC